MTSILDSDVVRAILLWLYSSMEGLKLVYTSSQPILELAKFGKYVLSNSQQLLFKFLSESNPIKKNII
jgi:hypothetical protein